MTDNTSSSSSSSGLDFNSNDRHFQMRASVTRNYGAVSVTFEITESAWIPNGEARRRAFESLISQIHDEHNEYAKHHLHNTPPPNTRNEGDYKKPGGMNSTYDAARVVKEVKDGKERVRIVTRSGKYAKFGCPIYPEVLENYPGLVEKLKGVWALDLQGVKVTIDESGSGKVISMEGVS